MYEILCKNIKAAKGKAKLINFSTLNTLSFFELMIFVKKYIETNKGIKSFPYSLYLANLISIKLRNNIFIIKIKLVVFDLFISLENK